MWGVQAQGVWESLHMLVPLVGLRVSLGGSDFKTLRLANRPGQPLSVIKASSGGSGGCEQSLSESKRDDLVLQAPDETSAKQWYTHRHSTIHLMI